MRGVYMVKRTWNQNLWKWKYNNLRVIGFTYGELYLWITITTCSVWFCKNMVLLYLLHKWIKLMIILECIHPFQQFQFVLRIVLILRSINVNYEMWNFKAHGNLSRFPLCEWVTIPLCVINLILNMLIQNIYNR